MKLFSKAKPKSSSAFSEFFRKASSAKRKRLYSKVLDKATERQRALMASISARGK